MTLQLIRVRCWPIVSPPCGTFLNFQKGCITGAVHIMLQELTYPKWCIRLHMVHLVTQCTGSSPYTHR